MKVVNSVAEMRQVRRGLRDPVGFVPTMGYLHEGHLTLVKIAKSENPSVVVSIFVNPTQFGPHEDFDKYPRDYPRDLAMLEKIGTDVVFMPGVSEMYPPGSSTFVEVTKVSDPLEGAIRPTHFRGVATVVAKLFNIVEPTKAYFGQKDAQQVLVIKKMVVDLDMNLEVVPLPTVREKDGLAMSSRNVYLNPDERRGSVVLNQALKLARQLYQGGEKSADKIRQQMADFINKERLANIQYVSVADAETLEEIEIIDRPAIALLAVRFGNTRLIDNMALD